MPPPMPVTMPISAAGSWPRSRVQRTETVLQRLEGAGDAEQGQPERVEDTDLALQPADRRVVGERHQPGRHRHHQVPPVGEGCRRGRPDEHVAQETTAETRRTGEHQDAEDVEVLADRDQCTGDGEDEDSDQVEHDEEG